MVFASVLISQPGRGPIFSSKCLPSKVAGRYATNFTVLSVGPLAPSRSPMPRVISVKPLWYTVLDCFPAKAPIPFAFREGAARKRALSPSEVDVRLALDLFLFRFFFLAPLVRLLLLAVLVSGVQGTPVASFAVTPAAKLALELVEAGAQACQLRVLFLVSTGLGTARRCRR